MRSRRLVVLVGFVAGVSALPGALAPSSAAGAAGAGANATVDHSVAHAESGPVRQMPTHTSSDEPKRSRPLRLVHAPGGGSSGSGHKPGGGGGGGTGSGSDNSTFPGTVGAGFAGIGNGDYGFTPDAAPPDTNGAAGYDPNTGIHQYVQWVNESFAVWNLTGSSATLAQGPVDGNSLFKTLGGGCAANNDGDPIAQFDKIAHRWVLTQFSVTNPSAYGYLQCVAVSDTADATGSYHTWAFSYGSSDFNDYPKLGVWPDAYYVTYDIFKNGTTYTGPRVCAWDRAAMLNDNATITQACSDPGSSYGPILPGDFDGTTLPPNGAADTFASFGSNSLVLWQAKPTFGSSPSFSLGTPTMMPVPSFTEACGGGTCIPQPKGKVDSLGDRLMYRLAYRVTSDNVEHMVVNHSVQTATAASGVRWYELTRTGGSGGWTLHQTGTYSPDGTSRWMGSAAMDKLGDIVVGYSASSSTSAPSIRVAARRASSTSAAGLLSKEVIIKAGGGSESGFGLTRWGDYSAMSVDPANDCTLWYTNEYEKTTGAFQWSTWIAPITLSGCS